MVIPGMMTAASQAATVTEKSGKLPALTAAYDAKQQAKLTAGTQLASQAVGQVAGVMQSMREKKRNRRMEDERKRRQQDAMQIEGAGTDMDMLAANMPGQNPYAERPIS
jgi:hypothetical protein